jgi:ATP-dependent RNA helicase DDX49/DBP8
LQSSLSELSITSPTEVQLKCIPEIVAGRDVIASAKTGQGKTLAFALPILQKLAQDPFGIFALILTPTRELAFQIAEQFRVLGTGINLKFSILVGGLDMHTQALEIAKRPHILVATPGRLRDHIESSDIDLSRLQFLVCNPSFLILGV